MVQNGEIIENVDEYADLMLEELLHPDDTEEDALPEWKRPKSAAYRRERRKRVREAAERGEVLPGHKKKGNMKYRRKNLTDRDRLVLSFLATVRVATAEHIAEVLGVKRTSAHHRLRGLAEWGMVNKIEIYPQSPSIFTLSSKGRRHAKKNGWIRENEGNGDTIDTIHMKNLMHHLGGTQAVLHMLRNAHVKREYIMNELEIMRLTGHVVKAGSLTSDKRAAVMIDYRYMENDVSEGMSHWDSSFKRAGIFYTYDISQIRRAVHRPDFVLNGEWMSDERGHRVISSCAIEVELSVKDDPYIEQIIRGYMSSGKIYANVVYFYNGEKIKDRFFKVAKRIGINMQAFEKRFIWIPLPPQRSSAIPMARMGVMD